MPESKAAPNSKKPVSVGVKPITIMGDRLDAGSSRAGPATDLNLRVYRCVAYLLCADNHTSSIRAQRSGGHSETVGCKFGFMPTKSRVAEHAPYSAGLTKSAPDPQECDFARIPWSSQRPILNGSAEDHVALMASLTIRANFRE
jgi:hypothetical protein